MRFSAIGLFLAAAFALLVGCCSSSNVKSIVQLGDIAGQAAPQPQKKESLALFPFTGGNASDGNSIVSSLTRQQVLRDAFNKVTLVTPNTIATMNFEQRFQRNSGLTDADTIFELGKALNASHVIAGYIAKLGNQNLVIVSIMDIESLQQIAGVYQTYSSIEEINRRIPEIAKKLAESVNRDTKGLPGLSVPPFNISSEVNQNDAMVLAQILSCDLANLGKYAILPRTDSVEYVLAEHQRQRSGITDQERIKRLGVGRNAQFVLSGSVERLGTSLKLTADVLDIVDGSFKDGYEEAYTDFSKGFELMPILAAKLSGGEIGLFIRVEGGTFRMGSNNGDNDEKPIHAVTVKSFSMAKYQVTQAEWFDVMGTNPSHFKGPNFPVENVSWFDVIEYCNRRSEKEGLVPVYRGFGDSITCDWNANGYRLPTEAEWEYAAKGGNKNAVAFEYSGSNSAGAVGWYSENSGGTTQSVGLKAPNSLGICDMSGNVWEWCWDRYGSYASGAQTDPKGASSGSFRVMRGGGWFSNAQYLRSASRSYFAPSLRYNYLGFRLVRN